MMNERILISRNKREGGYAGRTRYNRKSGRAEHPRHSRTGQRLLTFSLREWSRA